MPFCEKRKGKRYKNSTRCNRFLNNVVIELRSFSESLLRNAHAKSVRVRWEGGCFKQNALFLENKATEKIISRIAVFSTPLESRGLGMELPEGNKAFGKATVGKTFLAQ
jgi:hypothetical protein